MNINEEGKYYAEMVRKFRTEYKSKNLHGFCKDQKVSYTKMLHCLRNDSYRKPSAKPMSSDGEQGLHPLVVEPSASMVVEQTTSPVGQDQDLELDDIDLNFGSNVSLHIGSCSKTALVSLIYLPFQGQSSGSHLLFPSPGRNSDRKNTPWQPFSMFCNFVISNIFSIFAS